jgi:hypothetical protein
MGGLYIYGASIAADIVIADATITLPFYDFFDLPHP